MDVMEAEVQETIKTALSLLPSLTEQIHLLANILTVLRMQEALGEEKADGK